MAGYRIKLIYWENFRFPKSRINIYKTVQIKTMRKAKQRSHDCVGTEWIDKVRFICESNHIGILN